MRLARCIPRGEPAEVLRTDKDNAVKTTTLAFPSVLAIGGVTLPAQASSWTLWGNRAHPGETGSGPAVNPVVGGGSFDRATAVPLGVTGNAQRVLAALPAEDRGRRRPAPARARAGALPPRP